MDMGRAAVAEIVVPAPPDLTTCPEGATTQGQAYTLTMPSLATDPLRMRNRDGVTLTWAPTEMAHKGKDAANVTHYDYIAGSSPVSVSWDRNVVRYPRTFPNSVDVFMAQPEQVKHVTIVNERPRGPAVYLNPANQIWFGVAGIVSGVTLPLGEHLTMDVQGFHFPRPVAKAPLTGAETQGHYEVLDNEDGTQTLFVWFDYQWFLDNPGPWHLDPTVSTSTSSTATAYPNQRLEARFSNGVLFGMFYDGSNLVCRYSSDNGATWQTPATGATVGAYINGSVRMVDDHAFVSAVTSGNVLWIIVGTPTSAANTDYTWSALSTGFGGLNYPDCAVHAEGTGWAVHAVASYQVSTTNTVQYYRANVSSSGIPSYASGLTTIGGSYGVASATFPTIGVDTSKKLFGAWTTGATGVGKGIQYATAPYSSGTWPWSAGAAVTEAYYANQMGPSVVDSAGRFAVALRRHDAGNYLYVARLSAGSWSDISPSNQAGQNPTIAVNLTTDEYYLFYTNSGLKMRKYDGSWQAETTPDSDSTAAYPSARPNTIGSVVDAVYTTGSGSPYTVKSYRLALNVAPNAPTLTVKANFDATGAATFQWTFDDDDPGDTQGSYQLVITRVDTGATVVDTTKTASGTSSHTVSGATLTNALQYQWKVRTWDAADTEGSYSSLGSFWCSAKPTGTITYPANDGDTVATSSLTAQWSTSDPESEGQGSYRVELLSAADAVLWDSGKVSDTAARSRTIGYTLLNSTNYKVRLTVWDAKDVSGTAVVRTFTTSFTVPPTPTVTAEGSAASGRITVTWANPAPTGPEPSITGNDIYRRISGETSYVRIADNQPANSLYHDYAVASGVSYEYLVRALGSNGTTADGT